MINRIINYSECNKCLQCKKVCINENGIDINSEGYPEFNYNCIFCGHCAAICPRGAINFNVTELKDNQFIAEQKEITKEPEMLLFSLRSERKFIRKPIEKEKIKKVLEAMIRSLSAGNEQNRNYYIMTSFSQIEDFEKRIKKCYRKNTKFLKNSIIRNLLAILTVKKNKEITITNHLIKKLPYKEQVNYYRDSFASVINIDNYFYTNNAGVVIFVTSKKRKNAFHEKYYNGDARNAITYGTIMAKLLGLASCNLGLCEIAIKKDKTIQKSLNIPSDEQVEGILGLGYSDNDWKQIPLRGPAKTVWL
jgi:Fe-S-cluster-containing hydrogenase component 2